MLAPNECRVLGVLVEKALTTPAQYPLTLNALVNGCNQKNNRHPVTSLDEDDVLEALDGLRAKQLVREVLLTGSRVGKFRHTAREYPDRPAVRSLDGGDEISWGKLRERVDAVAGGLAELGLGRGDTLAIMLSNRPEFFVVDLAAMMLGAVPFSIYQTLSPEQIAYVVGDSGARIAVVERAHLETFRAAVLGFVDRPIPFRHDHVRDEVRRERECDWSVQRCRGYKQRDA